jgi:hypothetical protein
MCALVVAVVVVVHAVVGGRSECAVKDGRGGACTIKDSIIIFTKLFCIYSLDWTRAMETRWVISTSSTTIGLSDAVDTCIDLPFPDFFFVANIFVLLATPSAASRSS